MTSVNISERFKNIIRKQLEVNKRRLYLESSNHIEDNKTFSYFMVDHPINQNTYNHNFKSIIFTSIKSHDPDCNLYPYGNNNDDDDYDYDECKCKRKNTGDIYFHLHIIYKADENSQAILVYSHSVLVDALNSHSSFEDLCSEIPSIFNICNCGSVTDVNTKMCNECYINSYTRTEEEGGRCSICYENEGVWCKTKCPIKPHFFHKHCLDKARETNENCPLCRHRIVEVELNPFNI